MPSSPASLREALATKQSGVVPHRDSGLLRGACHPAALRADRVARNDESTFERPNQWILPHHVHLHVGDAGMHHAERLGCGIGHIDDASLHEWAAVVDPHHH
jgi:hypothetical protein